MTQIINFNESVSEKVGAVVTAFKIGPVLSDTILSILDQVNANIVGLIIVVDGCSYYKTTRSICQRYARAFNGLVHYIWLDNGGVSRARNRGVKWLMERFPDIRSILLLDGDDLLTLKYTESSVRLLREKQQEVKSQENKKIGWVYTDQLQFGQTSALLKYPRAFRSSRWLASNLSQPSGLVDRNMFESGVFWNEEMRQGIEDWEYWYSAIEAGYSGLANNSAYLLYRRLTGSRSSLNRANDALTKDYMRSNHPDLMTVQRFLEDEHDKIPRWAFAADNAWFLKSDPTAPGRRVSDQLFKDALSYRFSHPNPQEYISDPYFPDMLAFLDPRDEMWLAKYGLLHAVLNEVELALRDSPMCFLDITQYNTHEQNGHTLVYQLKDAFHFELTKDNLTNETTFCSSFFVSIGGFFCCYNQLFQDHLTQSSHLELVCEKEMEDIRVERNTFLKIIDRLESFASALERSNTEQFQYNNKLHSELFELADSLQAMSLAQPVVQQLSKGISANRLTIISPSDRLPSEPPHLKQQECYGRFIEFSAKLVGCVRQPKAPGILLRPNHRHCGGDKANHATLGSELFGVWPIIPRLKSQKCKDIAIVLPCGVTQSFEDYIKLLKSVAETQRFRIHLVSLGAGVPAKISCCDDLVKSRTAFNISVNAWTPQADQNYFGVPLYERINPALQNNVFGSLITMDEVINFAGPIVSGPMLMLNKSGILTTLVYDPNESGVPFADLYTRNDIINIFNEPISVLAYTGAYKRIVVPDDNTAIMLEAEGVPRALIQVGHRIEPSDVEEA